MRPRRITAPALSLAVALLAGAGCGGDPNSADLILTNGAIYTFQWPDPQPDGRPSLGAPYDTAARTWSPDAQAVAIRGDEVLYVGHLDSAMLFGRSKTRVIDLQGRTVIPGLADAHTHAAELGSQLGRVTLTGEFDEAQAVAKVVERAKTVPVGEWIVGTGWDEGASANRYPTMALLSDQVPDHPVFLRGLHGFAAWGNRLAFEKAGITRDTRAPEGGEILHDGRGEPTGVVTNSAVALLSRAIPPTTQAQMEQHLDSAFAALLRAGYTSIHEASVGPTEMAALGAMAARGALPLRVYVWLDGRDTALMREWHGRGPDTTSADNLVVRSVKVFADGALGSRGARLLADYSDRPGHRGITGGAYGYDPQLMKGMMEVGFQAVIHAIGDAANRETLDFFESVIGPRPMRRDRIEHAQVVSLDDISRFSSLGVIASMQPSHSPEDMPWAEQRVGAERIKGAYAWRTLRMSGARLVFSSDLPATDYDIFYGLHSATTRTGKDGKPAGGWRAQEALTMEEALRGFTAWAAYASFDEVRGGTITQGGRADLTVLTIDPFKTSGDAILKGGIAMTIAGGKVAFERK